MGHLRVFGEAGGDAVERCPLSLYLVLENVRDDEVRNQISGAKRVGESLPAWGEELESEDLDSVPRYVQSCFARHSWSRTMLRVECGLTALQCRRSC